MSGEDTGSQLPAPVTPSSPGGSVVPADDGFQEAVPFKPLELRINRQRGAFWLDGDSEPRDEVYVVPRGAHKARSFFAHRYDPKQPREPSCQSPDGRFAYGYINEMDPNPDFRQCFNCPKKGYGADYCSEIMVLIAYDLGREVPVFTRFRNQEINPRKGVFTLAINTMRSKGLQAATADAVFRMRFKENSDNPNYQDLIIDVADNRHAKDGPNAAEIEATLNACWSAYNESRQAEIDYLSGNAGG